jgi:2-desacetyl-2-hydroxyethyl bacteriochlorophyllide A dehydrogenase
MKVLKVIEPGKFEFEERPIPVPAKDEVLLKMKYCGICGSDVKVFSGKHPYAKYPRIMGHEISAELFNGEAVSVNPYFTCGKCSACLSGRKNCCLENQTMGVQRDGAYAEYITVPITHLIMSSLNLSPINLSLIEPYAVAYRAIHRATIDKNTRVLIYGAGPIGTFCYISSSKRGAIVNIIDHHDKKVRIAEFFNPSKTNEMEYDVCIDATGSKDAIQNCFNFAKTGGTIILIGHSKEEIPMPHSDIIKKELTILASRNSNSEDIYQAQNEIKLTPDINKVITSIVPFAKVPEFFKEIHDINPLKALIEF